MPPKKNYKKKNYKKKNHKKKLTVGHLGNPSGLPIRRTVSMRWAQFGKMSGTPANNKPFITKIFSIMIPSHRRLLAGA